MTSKILTVVYSLGKGGTQRAAQVFAQAYAQMKIDSRLLATKEGGIREKELREKNIFYWLGVDDDVIKEISEWNPDLIHFHSHGIEQNDIDKLSQVFDKCKLVEQNVFSEVSCCTPIVDISFQMSYWCNWRFRLANNTQNIKTDVIPYPVDTNAFSRCSTYEINKFKANHGIRSNKLVIGRVGQNLESKWSPLLIDIFDGLRQECVTLHLLLVNPPKSIVEKAKHSPFSSDITVIDVIIGDKNLSIAYSAMDIFALIASQGESFGMALAESMLCETPVVALSTPWKDNSQCEVVGHMEGGLIANSPNGFENALREFIKNQSLRRSLGQNGRKRIIDKYNSYHVAKRVLQSITSDGLKISKKDLDNKIMHLYKNAFDKPPILSRIILKGKKKLGLIRYISSYSSISSIIKSRQNQT